MNRKLHNTASALMVPGTLLLLGLAAHAYTDGRADAASAASSPAAVVASATAELPTRSFGGRAGRVRNSVALPFFSFASRG